MQPNQQDPYPQSTPPTPSSNIPEYLHMDSVPDPISSSQRRSKKKLFIVLALFVLAVVVLLSVFVTWYLNSNTPQEKFYRALERNLQVSYVERDYTVKNIKSQKQTDYKVKTDFSQPAQPKSYLVYSDSKTSSDSKTVKYTGEKIVLNKNEYFDMITSVSPKEAATGAALNRWRSLQLNTSAPYYFEGIDSLQGLNSVQGIVVTGNFTESQRRELVAFIKSSNAYTVTSHKTSVEAGRQLSDYVVKIDLDKVNELNKKAVNLVGSSLVIDLAKSKSEDGELRVIVDDESGLITKITYTITSKEATVFEKSETITYPATLSIEKPAIVNTEDSSNS